MKKEDISGVVVYVLIFVLTLVFALLVVREYYAKSGMEIFEYVLFVLGAFVTGIVFNAILFELAHMLGAKIGKYSIVSVSILGLTFYKTEGKRKVGFKSFNGFTGETKILPNPKVEKKANPTPYCLCGSLFYAVEIVAVVFLFSFLNSDTVSSIALHNLGYFFLIVGVVGGAILLYNIIPLRLDSMTDGYRLVLLSNKKNRNAFNELLLLENSDNPDAKKAFKEKEIDKTTAVAFSSDIKLNQVFLLLDEDNFLEAEAMLDEILVDSNKLNSKTYAQVKGLKLFLMINFHTLEEATEYYEKQVPYLERKHFADDNSFNSVRTYILLSSIMDNSKSECMIAVNKVYKAFKKLPKERQNLEAKLYNMAIAKIATIRPNWRIEEYVLKV